MPGPTPNPDSDDSRGWTTLPRSHSGVVPELGDWFEWSERAQSSWISWWSSPMGSQWRPEDADALERLMHMQMTVWGEVMETVFDGDGDEVEIPARVSGVLLSEMRMLADQFGLTPASRRRLRWLVDDVDPVAVVASEGVSEGRMPSLADVGLSIVT